MGGIFGVATTDSALPVSRFLEAMGSALRREGEPLTYRAEAGFGAGVAVQFPRWQTLLNEDGSLVVAADAEIYNRQELERSLGAEISSPAGAIAALYRKHGRDWMSKVSGTFSVALWDGLLRRLMLVTDRFGVRPLVYAGKGGSLFFASRLRALARPCGLERRVRPLSIYNYLFYGMVPTPDAIYEGMHKLPPGHFLLWQEGRVEIGSYWDMTFPEENHPLSYFEKRLSEEIEQAVGRTLADWEDAGTVGSFLSGGTDSSTVTGMLRKRTGAPPRTFSIGFDVPGYNEIDYARTAAGHFGAEHHEYFVTAEDTARGIDTVVEEYDEPFGNSSAVPTLYCAQLARTNGVELMLAGDGGDELFGGNERYATHQVFALYEEIPVPLRRYFIEPIAFGFPEDAAVPLVERARKYIRRASLPKPERFFSYNFLSTVPTEAIFSEDFRREISGVEPVERARQYFSQARATNDLNRELYCDLKLTLTDNDLRKVTQMTEKKGVRVRYPMLDESLAIFSGTIPSPLKVRRFALRYIFKRALQDFLPIEVIQKKKHGFGLPWSAWLKTNRSLQEILRSALLDQVAFERGYFNRSFLERLFADTQTDPTPFSGAAAWVFMMLELWHRRHEAQFTS